MFTPDDPHIDETVRQTGFYRYRQLMNTHFGSWWKVNFLTLLGFVPLAAGIFYAIGASSVLVLLPCSIVGGMIAGPFLAGMYDALLRGLRDDPLPWKDAYARSWKQNWKGSLLPGAVLGLVTGVYAFFGMMLLWWANTSPGLGTVALTITALVLVLAVSTLYWVQLVLFRQRASIRLRNCLLFCIQYFWRVLGVGVLQAAYWLLMLLFAPWTLLLLPVTGVWYILFVSCFALYGQLDEAFQIENHPEEE